MWKTYGKGSITAPPPPPLYHGGDITLFVRPGVKWVIHFDAVECQWNLLLAGF